MGRLQGGLMSRFEGAGCGELAGNGRRRAGCGAVDPAGGGRRTCQPGPTRQRPQRKKREGGGAGPAGCRVGLAGPVCSRGKRRKGPLARSGLK
jgi:hypothetical protein